MKKHIISIIMTAIFISPGVGLAQAPHEVGGFVLGKNIAEFKANVDMGTALPVRYSEFLTEVEIRGLDGFKSGLIGFGTCKSDGIVLRIKLKYADSSKKFYDELLNRTKKRFGEPEEWRGDPFHIFRAWKWSFLDKDGNSISMIIQHNTQDDEEKLGNAVKLTMISQMEKEEACFEKKHPGFRRQEDQKGVKNEKSPMDWERFVPR